MPADAPSLPDEIRSFIEASNADFAALALRVFAYQFARNTPYRAYCKTLGHTPDTVRSWRAIPPVPTDAFKLDLPICSFPPEEATRIFLTSGTTTEIRGRHLLRDLDLYARSVRAGWTQAGLPGCGNAWFLAPPPGTTPESSLETMFAILASDDDSERWLIAPDGHFRLDPLREAASRAEPLLLFSTALNLLRLETAIPDGLTLPPGSWVFQTGGYKGLHRAVTPETVYHSINRCLRVPPEQVINEYGMTELCSQAYAVGAGTAHHLPPWMRVRAIDPHTGADSPRQASGYLVFHDLANLQSVSAIRTQDFGRVIDDGAFFLDGRDPGALPRGCSRGSDAFAPARS